MMMRGATSIALVVAALTGCQKADLQKLSKKYESAPYYQTRTSSCMEISAIYVAPEWKALQELIAVKMGEGSVLPNLDSAFQAHRSIRSLEFRINVSPAPKCRDTLNFHNSDVVYAGVGSNEEMDKAVKSFNETIRERIWLKVGGSRIKPVLAHVESSFGLDNSRVIWVAFETDDGIESALMGEEKFDLAVEDITPGRGLFMLSWPRKVYKRRA